MNEIQKHNQLNADALIQMLNLLQDYPEALKAINPQLNILLANTNAIAKEKEIIADSIRVIQGGK